MKRKLALASVAVVVLASLMVLSMLTRVQEPENVSPNSLTIEGYVVVEVYRPGVGIIYHYESSNLITDIGKRYIRDVLGFDNRTAPTNSTTAIALSDTDLTPNATWTKLFGEITTDGLERASGSAQVINATAYNVTHTFTAGITFTGVKRSGLHWSNVTDTDNNLFAVNTFSAVNLEADDQLTVTWTIQVA